MYEMKKKKYTIKDFEQLPEGSPYQLIDGELIMSPSPIPYHQEIALKLGSKILSFVEKNDLGKVYLSLDVSISETEIYQPDIIFISKENLDIIGEKRIEGAPDVVIEILSPSTAYYDLIHKKNIYQQSGIKEYWIIDPIEKFIEIFENSGKDFTSIQKTKGDELVKSKMIKDFQIKTGEIF